MTVLRFAIAAGVVIALAKSFDALPRAIPVPFSFSSIVLNSFVLTIVIACCRAGRSPSLTASLSLSICGLRPAINLANSI